MFLNKSQSLFEAKAKYHTACTGRVVVLGNTRSATNDFYFRARKDQAQHYVEIDITDEDCLSQLYANLTQGSRLILVRDVPLLLLKKLVNSNLMVSDVIWFMDDDFPGAGEDKSLPDAVSEKNIRLVSQGITLFKQAL